VGASLLPAVAIGKENGCTAATATAAGTTPNCPNIAIEDDAAVLKVGYTPYSTLKDHC
jgi:hypothetical protein